MTKFYLLIAGSRDYKNYAEMDSVLDTLLAEKIHAEDYDNVVIVSGGARGADALAEKYASEHLLENVVIPAEWDKYGKSAGYKRNEEMHLYIAAPSTRIRGCILFWDMKSPGTKQSFSLSQKYHNPLWVFNTIEHRFLSHEEIQKYI